MTRHVSLTLAASLALALAAGAERPRLSAGHPSLLSAAPAFGEAPGAQRIGSIVATDDGWIAAWADDIDATATEPGYRRFLATRLLPDGTPVDATGLRIGAEQSYAAFAAVSDGAEARVFRLPRVLAPPEVSVSTIASDGRVAHVTLPTGLDGDRTPDSLTAAAAGSRTALLSNGRVMLYEGDRHLRTVDLGGFGEPSSIAATSSHFVVTWIAAGNVFMAQTLDLDGNLTGPAGGIGVGFPASAGTAAASRDGALLAWGEGAWLRLATVDPASGAVTKKASVLAEYAVPRAVWTGSSYLVAWHEPSGQAVLGVRVSSGGELVDTEPVSLYDGFSGPFTLAARGSDVMMLHQSGDCVRLYCATDVWATRLLPSGGPSHLISAAALEQSAPAAASNGSGFLAVWNEGSGIAGTLTAPGNRDASLPFVIGTQRALPSLVVASDGHDYLAAWTAHHDGRYFVEGARVGIDGPSAASRLVTFSIDAGALGPQGVAVGSSPTGYLVAWQQGASLYASRVGTDGTLVDPVPVPMYPGALSSPPSAVAFDGADFVVSGTTYTGAAAPASTVFTLRVTQGGTATFDRTWTTAEQGAILTSTLGCGSATCLVAWVQRADPYGLTWQLLGRRFRTGGEPIDDSPFTIDFSESNHVEPRVAWDGARFIVSWSGMDDDGTTPVVEARSIPASGEVEQGGAFLSDRLAESYPAAPVACSGDGRCILVNATPVDDESLGRTSRLVKRFFGEARHRGVRR